MTAPSIGGGHVPIDPGTGFVWGSDGAGNAAPVSGGSQPTFDPRSYGAKCDGVTDDSAAVALAFAAMKADGTHATGILSIPNNCVINSPVVLDGGYVNVASSAANPGDKPQFQIQTTGSLIAGSQGQALIVRGFYNPKIDVRFQGGGARRTISDAAITSGAATLTSATAAFTSADKGSTVKVVGAGPTAGGAAQDFWATITNVTNATTVTLSANAGNTVSGAAAAIQTVALHIGNIDGGVVRCRGYAYAGTLFHVDVSAVVNENLKETTVEHLYGSGCGQTLYMRAVNGSGMGPLQNIVDNFAVDSSYFQGCSDFTLDSYEMFAPSTQTGLTFELCNTMHINVLDLGAANPTDAVVRWYGFTGSNSDASTINLLRVGPALVSSNPATDGIKIMDTTSLHILSVESKNCLKAVHVIGSKVSIGYGHSLTKDQDWLYIEGDTFNLAPEVRVTDGFWRNVTQHLAFVNANATGAGRLDIAGYVDTPNQSGTAGIAMVDVQGTAMKLNVSGLKQLHRSTMSGGSVKHATAGLTRGLLGSELTNTPMTVLANPATLSLTTGTALQNDPNANNGMSMYVTVGIAWAAGAGTVTIALGNASGAVVSLQQISKGASGLAENDMYGPILVPPDWFIKVTLTGGAAFGTNHQWFV